LIGDHDCESELKEIVVRRAYELRPEKGREAFLFEKLKLAGMF
jgi:hypothetical protein